MFDTRREALKADGVRPIREAAVTHGVRPIREVAVTHAVGPIREAAVTHAVGPIPEVGEAEVGEAVITTGMMPGTTSDAGAPSGPSSGSV